MTTGQERDLLAQTADALLTRHCDAPVREAAEESGWAGGLWDELERDACACSAERGADSQLAGAVRSARDVEAAEIDAGGE